MSWRSSTSRLAQRMGFARTERMRTYARLRAHVKDCSRRIPVGPTEEANSFRQVVSHRYAPPQSVGIGLAPRGQGRQWQIVFIQKKVEIHFQNVD